jgi:class 3 adenylate cyclase
MGKFLIKGKPALRTINKQRARFRLISNDNLEKFNSNILGLGDIRSKAKNVEALAAIFDLSGFTNFCSRTDPDLEVPEYLSSFLGWLFNEIKRELTAKKSSSNAALWAELPFFSKFLGDGVLFLWDTKDMSERLICNVVVSLRNVCAKYRSKFYPEIKKVVGEPPKTLRCGIARGRVSSVGSEQDYVGPCINIAARLQKLSYLTFCFSRRGFDIEEYMHEDVYKYFVEKCITIRGIGENELIWVLKEEFEEIPEEGKKLFREP